MTKFTTILAAETTVFIARKMLNTRYVSLAQVTEQVAALIQDDRHDADGRGEITEAFNRLYDLISNEKELYAALRGLEIDASTQAKALLDTAWSRQVINKCAERGLVVTVGQVLGTETMKNRFHFYQMSATVQELLNISLMDVVVAEAYKEATGETITEQQAATALIDFHQANPDGVTCSQVVEYLKANKPASVVPKTDRNAVLPLADIRAMGLRDLSSWLDAERLMPSWGKRVYTRAYLIRVITDNLADRPDDLSPVENNNFAIYIFGNMCDGRLITPEEYVYCSNSIRQDGCDPLVVLDSVRDALRNGSPIIPKAL